MFGVFQLSLHLRSYILSWKRKMREADWGWGMGDSSLWEILPTAEEIPKKEPEQVRVGHHGSSALCTREIGPIGLVVLIASVSVEQWFSKCSPLTGSSCTIREPDRGAERRVQSSLELSL